MGRSDRASSDDATMVELCTTKTTLLLSAGDNKAAMQTFFGVLTFNHQNERALFSLAKLSLSSGMVDSCENLCERILLIKSWKIEKRYGGKRRRRERR